MPWPNVAKFCRNYWNSSHSLTGTAWGSHLTRLKLFLSPYKLPTVCPPIDFQNRLRRRPPSKRTGLRFPHPENLTHPSLLTQAIISLAKAILLKDQARSTFHPSTVLEDRHAFYLPTYLTVALGHGPGEMPWKDGKLSLDHVGLLWPSSRANSWLIGWRAEHPLGTHTSIGELQTQIFRLRLTSAWQWATTLTMKSSHGLTFACSSSSSWLTTAETDRSKLRSLHFGANTTCSGSFTFQAAKSRHLPFRCSSMTSQPEISPIELEAPGLDYWIVVW